jgi:hypothetical protein
MRPLFISLAAGALAFGTVWAQTPPSSEGGNMPQLPVGQTFKNFEYPYYQDGKLKFTGSAAQAKGITLNRAETTDLKIDVYDNGAVTTTITSPKADLYVNEQILRTKNTVQIDRADMVATSQDCNFDLKNKKYVLRNNVKVVLKHIDFGASPSTTAVKPRALANPAAAPTPAVPRPAGPDSSMLESPGYYSDTNSAPTPTGSDTK